MLEFLTGSALAAAAGLNAYVPLIGVGLLSRFTELLELPAGWAWLESEWTLGILAILLAIELVVDKVPALDTLNDVLQTVVRPGAGGLVFSAGVTSETVVMSDPQSMLTSDAVWPFIIGAAIAFIPHLLKMLARPVINAVTLGAGAVASSTLEDLGAVALTFLAVLAPVIAVVLVVGVIALLIRRLRRRRRDAAIVASART